VPLLSKRLADARVDESAREGGTSLRPNAARASWNSRRRTAWNVVDSRASSPASRSHVWQVLRENAWSLWRGRGRR
jgi:hypothetical protein